MVEAQIEALMRVLEARNEYELSTKLGLSRSAVSQWRHRGAVPARFYALLNAPGGEAVSEATYQQLFRKPEYHYWLRAALVLAAGVPASPDPSGRRQEQLIVDLMALAMRVTHRDLGMSRIRDEAALHRLIERLRRAYSEEIQGLLSRSG